MARNACAGCHCMVTRRYTSTTNRSSLAPSMPCARSTAIATSCSPRRQKGACAAGCAPGPTSADRGGVTGSPNSGSMRSCCASASRPTPIPSVSRSSTSERGRRPAPWPDVQRHTAIALVIGLAATVAAVIYAGAGAVAQAIATLHLSGLLVLVLLHLPIVVLMGLAWRLASGSDPPASQSRFVWARFVRDAAGELLPFLQLGGIVFGLRALGRGRAIAVGAVSASIDGVIELAAKLPYAFATLLTLLALAPQSRLARLLSLALAATGALVAILLLARRSLSGSLQAMARAVSARWPSVLSLDGPDGFDLQACFHRIMSQRG